MELTIIILGIVLLLLGVLGSLIPVIPGPSFSFVSILLLHFFTPYKSEIQYLFFLGSIVFVVIILDYFLQIYGVKKFGGKQKAINGTIIGLIIGIFVPIPFGFLIGPFIGAFIGAYIEEKDNLLKIFSIALGSIVGLFTGTVLKLILTCYLGFEFFNILLNG